MSKALSVDLRVRVVAAVLAGATHRQAAERFGVSAASVSRWRRLAQQQGDARPSPLGGDRRSGPIEAQAGLIQALLDEAPDITIEELLRALGAQGHWFGYGTVHRFFRRHRAVAKLKAMLRKAAARTVDTLWNTIAQVIETFAPAQCTNYFAAAEYDPD